MVQSNRESQRTFPWSGAFSSSDSSDLDSTHLCLASSQQRYPAVWTTGSGWNTVLNKWSQIDRWITRQVWSVIFRTEIKYMHIEGEITGLAIIKWRKVLGSVVNPKQNESATWCYCKKKGKFIMSLIVEVLDRRWRWIVLFYLAIVRF